MRLRRLLEARRIVVVASLVGVLLSLVSVGGGLQSEDLVFRDLARTSHVSLPWNVNLFGERQRRDAETVLGHNWVERAVGAQPWISADVFKVSFWRPLSSLTHIADYELWPHGAWLMHAQNVGWYALLVGAVAWLYRRVQTPAWVAGLAAILYAVDDAHGHAVGWISNRNALIAALFAVLAIGFHDRWRRDGWWRGAVLSPLSLALGLMGAEVALGALGYLIAHALFLDRASRSRRLIAALPWLAVVVAWGIFYQMRGHGAYGSGLYLDPSVDLLSFAAEGPARAAVLLLAQLAAPPSDVWATLYPSRHLQLAAAAFVGLAAIGWIAWPVLKRDRVAQFWVLGMLLSVLPAACALPEDRLLLLTGVGGAALVARVIAAGFDRDEPADSRPANRRLLWGLAVVFVGVHAVVAPILLPYRTLTMKRYHERLERLSNGAFARIENMHETLVIVNSPDFYFGAMMVMTRIARRQPIAHHAVNLVGGTGRASIRGVDPHAVEVRPEGGFYTRPFNRIYRGRLQPLRARDVIRYRGVEVTIVDATSEGEPTAAIFRFEMALADPRMRWAVLHEGSYHPIDPPRPGQTIEVGEP